MRHLATVVLSFVSFTMPINSHAESGTPPAPLFFHASQPGKQTLDQGEGGGNPFASALIELLARNNLALDTFPVELANLTEQKSRGFQRPDVPGQGEPADWRFSPKPPAEKRSALVLVFSDYSASQGALSLPGAKRDSERIGVALEKAGFETEAVLDPDKTELKQVLETFADRSSKSDVAILYTTGHGVEVDRKIYLLPGDYPIRRGIDALQEHAVRLSELATVTRAKRANLVFWGGCRDNPLD